MSLRILQHHLVTHTCDISFEPDREIWDFSEGDLGFLRGRLGSQIGRFLHGKNISYIRQKSALLTLLKINFFNFGCHNPIMQLSSGTVIILKRISGGYLT